MMFNVHDQEKNEETYRKQLYEVHIVCFEGLALHPPQPVLI